MKRIFVFIALTLSLALTATAGPKMKKYKIVTRNEETVYLDGTKIRTSGFCVELLIGKTVDTIMCNVAYVTEVPVAVEAPRLPTAEPEGPEVVDPQYSIVS